MNQQSRIVTKIIYTEIIRIYSAKNNFRKQNKGYIFLQFNQLHCDDMHTIQ